MCCDYFFLEGCSLLFLLVLVFWVNIVCFNDKCSPFDSDLINKMMFEFAVFFTGLQKSECPCFTLQSWIFWMDFM